jgi:hypothetical protein
VLAPLLLFAAACGGDDPPEATPTVTATEAARTPTATPTPTPAPATSTPETAATEASQAPGGTLTGVIASPYETFHYLVRIDMGVIDGATDALFGGRVEGDYVAPDRHAFTNEFGFSGLTITTDSIIIGTDAWNREGSGPWTASSIEALFADGSIGLTSADPEFFGFDTEASAGFAGLSGESETLNGIETTRYVLDRELYAAVAPFLGDTPTGEMDVGDFEEFSTTVWIDTAANALVRMDLFMTAPAAVLGEDLSPLGVAPDATLSMTMTFEMTRIDDDGIAIEVPLP